LYAIDSEYVNNQIRLGDELDQVMNFIFLSQLKKKSGPHLDVVFNDEVLDIYLIPLVLLTIVENIFKHGNLVNSN
jgi:two-component system LytT family sensor kinase